MDTLLRVTFFFIGRFPSDECWVHCNKEFWGLPTITDIPNHVFKRKIETCEAFIRYGMAIRFNDFRLSAHPFLSFNQPCLNHCGTECGFWMETTRDVNETMKKAISEWPSTYKVNEH